jgi:hypothetical protein
VCTVLLFLLDSSCLICYRFSTRAIRFMDAYRKGLTGKQAAWASKKYRGHRVLPESLLHDLAKSDMD